MKKVLAILSLFLLITSCSNNSEQKDIQQTNNKTDDIDMNLLVSITTPSGYVLSNKDEESNITYYVKENDPNAKEGYIICSSLNKIDAPTDELIASYSSYFDSDSNILSYTTDTLMTDNDIECIIFTLKLSDNYNRICYALTNSRDICIEAIYYDETSDIIKGQDEFINSIVDNADDNYKYDNSTSIFISEALNNSGIEMNDNWHCYKKDGNPYYDITNTWYVPESQYIYFSNISNGYTNFEPLIAHNYEELKSILSTNILEPGDLAFFSNKDSEYMEYALMITNIDDNGMYLTCKTHNDTLLQNSLLDSNAFNSIDVYFISLN